jgi:hypothetical protein
VTIDKEIVSFDKIDEFLPNDWNVLLKGDNQLNLCYLSVDEGDMKLLEKMQVPKTLCLKKSCPSYAPWQRPIVFRHLKSPFILHQWHHTFL